MKWKLGHYYTSNPPTVCFESQKRHSDTVNQLNSRDCGAVDKNLGNELKIYFLALSKTTLDVLSSFFPTRLWVQMSFWILDATSPDVSNFYSPLISHLEPEPPPLIRTKWRRRGKETEQRRKEESTQEALNKMRHPSFRAVIMRDSGEIW